MSVVVTDLRRRFTKDGPPAVAGVSFTAPTGAITAILGPSGAGKSTVLRLIAGLEEPDAGRVILHDQAAALRSDPKVRSAYLGG